MIDKKTGKTIKTIMRSFSLDEISAVDRPAQAHATVAIMKRDDSQLRKLEVSVALTAVSNGHSHLITAGGGEYYRRAGSTDYTDGHTHPWLIDEAGNIKVGYAQGHTHEIEVVGKGEMTEEALKRLLSKEGEPAASKDDHDPAGSTAAEPIGNHEDQSMTPEEKKAAEQAAAAQKAEMDNLTKRAERAESIAGLSDTHRSHFRLLKGAEGDEFLKQNETERDETIRKAQEANRIVYKAEDGTTFRQSDDTRLVEMAKGLDMERKKRREMEEKAAKAELEKLAKDLTHLPGSDEERLALVKGVQSLPEAEREKAMAALKSHNERLGKAFQRVGTSAVPADDTLDPLDQLATDIAKRDNVSFEQAYDKALNTPAGQKLYHEHVNKRFSGAQV